MKKSDEGSKEAAQWVAVAARRGSGGKSGRPVTLSLFFLPFLFNLYFKEHLSFLSHFSRVIQRYSSATDGMTHQRRAPVTRAAPLKEQLHAVAGEGAQIFTRWGGNLLYPPRVFVLACGAAAARKFPVLMMQKRQKRRQDGVDVGKETHDDCRWFRQNSATPNIWNDDVFLSRKVSWCHMSLILVAKSCMIVLKYYHAFLQKDFHPLLGNWFFIVWWSKSRANTCLEVASSRCQCSFWHHKVLMSKAATSYILGQTSRSARH